MNGRVNGERLMEFLPANLRAMIPTNSAMTDQEKIDFLHEKIGENRLIKSLVDNFFMLGREGEDHADESWKILGLDTKKRTIIGLALQSLLEVIDQTVEEMGVDELHGMISIDNRYVTFSMLEGNIIDSIEGYQVAAT